MEESGVQCKKNLLHGRKWSSVQEKSCYIFLLYNELFLRKGLCGFSDIELLGLCGGGIRYI